MSLMQQRQPTQEELLEVCSSGTLISASLGSAAVRLASTKAG